MRVVICGSPHWNYDILVRDEIVRLKRQSALSGTSLFVIHGGEPGPESVAAKVCAELGIDQAVYPAARARGDGAWARRNQIMLQEHPVDAVVVFTHSVTKGSVTHDMIRRAELKGVRVKVVDAESLRKRDPDEVGIKPVGGGY